MTARAAMARKPSYRRSSRNARGNAGNSAARNARMALLTAPPPSQSSSPRRSSSSRARAPRAARRRRSRPRTSRPRTAPTTSSPSRPRRPQTPRAPFAVERPPSPGAQCAAVPIDTVLLCLTNVHKTFTLGPNSKAKLPRHRRDTHTRRARPRRSPRPARVAARDASSAGSSRRVAATSAPRSRGRGA